MSVKIIRIRLRLLRNLIFFSLFLLSACAKKTEAIRLIWNKEQVIGISIPKNSIGSISDSLDRQLMIRLVKDGDPIAMFGNYKIDHDEIIFEPLVPFTRGLRYQVLINHRVVQELFIPPIGPKDAPSLLAIYPTEDTVPENLLKMYLQFSKPMREGQSVSYLTLLRNNYDTVQGAFLDLQPELWNEDRTMLTVWLDPGRIKRGLHPNKLYGAPLQKGANYTLAVSNQWKDVEGATLAMGIYKNFSVTLRDSLSPDPQTWTIHNPKTGTTHALQIALKSPLDYSLLKTTLHIVNAAEQIIPGDWQIENQEREVSFIPKTQWVSGVYQLQIETRLEDLAGNNLNRAFDRDVKARVQSTSTAKIISIQFPITN